MDTKKFEKLITLVINEDNAAASALVHDIVVEKSREIFESIMDEDDMESDGSQVGDMMAEINAEEEGLDEEEEFDMDVEDDMGDDEEIEFDDEMSGDDFEDGGDEDEETLIRIEDKLDQLMAEFEEIMGGEEEADFGGEEDFGSEEDFGAEDDMGDEEDFGDEDEEAMMEAIQLKKISVTHGDNGSQTKSPVTFNSGSKGMDSKPVSFSGHSEANPTSPKKPSNPYTKGETSVKGAGNFKNSPGKGNFSEKGEAAPKPTKGDNGSNAKSPVAESRRTTRRPIR